MPGRLHRVLRRLRPGAVGAQLGCALVSAVLVIQLFDGTAIARPIDAVPASVEVSPDFSFSAGPSAGQVILNVPPGTARSFVDGLLRQYELGYVSGPAANGTYLLSLPEVKVVALGDNRAQLTFPLIATPADIAGYLASNNLQLEAGSLGTDPTGHRTAIVTLSNLTLTPLDATGTYATTLPTGMTAEAAAAWASQAGLALVSYNPATGATVVRTPTPLAAPSPTDVSLPASVPSYDGGTLGGLPSSSFVVNYAPADDASAPQFTITPNPGPTPSTPAESTAPLNSMYMRLAAGATMAQVYAALAGLQANASDPDQSGLIGLTVRADRVAPLFQLLADSPAVSCVGLSAAQCPATATGPTLAAPVSLRATNGTFAALAWPIAPGAAAYAVWRSATPQGPWTYIALVSPPDPIVGVPPVTTINYGDQSSPAGILYYRVMSLPACTTGTPLSCYQTTPPAYSSSLASPAAEVSVATPTAPTPTDSAPTDSAATAPAPSADPTPDPT
ncbi:MAG: hypothetical protein JWN20_2693, partial [Jatrophihabitantaceae bacterium]|nr:hypothetical protein [Jatrophihabitantaceae bacterium]